MNKNNNQPITHILLRTSQSRKSEEYYQNQPTSNEQIYINKSRFNPNQQFHVCRSRPKTQPKYRGGTNLPIFIVPSTQNPNNFNRISQNQPKSNEMPKTNNYRDNSNRSSSKREVEKRDQKIRQDMDLCLYTAIDKLKQLNSNEIDIKNNKISFSQARTNKMLNQMNDKTIHRIQPQLLNKYIQTVYKQYDIDNPFGQSSQIQRQNEENVPKIKQQSQNRIKYLRQQKIQKRNNFMQRKKQQKKFINVTLSKQKSINRPISPKNNHNKNIQPKANLNYISPQRLSNNDVQQQNKNKSLSRSSKKIKQLKNNISNNQEEVQNLNYYERSPYQLLNRTGNIKGSTYQQDRTRIFQQNSLEVRSVFMSKDGEVQPQFRFCLLCQQAILSINIQKHQKRCSGYTSSEGQSTHITFTSLYRMNDKQLRQFLAERIKKIRQRIQNRIKKIQNIEFDFKNYSEQVCKKIVHSVQNYLQTTQNNDMINQHKILNSHAQIIKTANNQYFLILDDVTKLHWFVKIYDNYSSNKTKYFETRNSQRASKYQKANNDSTKDRRFFDSIIINPNQDNSISDFKIRQSLLAQNCNIN